MLTRELAAALQTDEDFARKGLAELPVVIHTELDGSVFTGLP